MELKSRLMVGCEPYIKIGNNGIGLILQHGASATPAAMMYAAAHFHEKGYTVLAPRLAGHGTEPSDLKRCNVDDFRTELEIAVALLRSCCDKVILCGISMGGLIASILGAYSDVDGLVLMATPSPKIINEMKSAVFKKTDKQEPEGESGWYKPELRVNWRTYDMKSIMSNTIAAMITLVKLQKAALPKIKTPVLLLYSKKDMVVSPTHGEVIYNIIPAEKKYLHILENSGHVLVADGERDTVFELIEDFIETKVLVG